MTSPIRFGELFTQATTLVTGEFPVIFTDADLGETTTGKTMIRCRLKVESGPHAGHVFRNNFIISPENITALKIFFRHMEALGLDKKFFTTDPDPEAVASAIRGKRARVRVETGSFRGVDQEEVKAVLPPGPAVPLPPGSTTNSTTKTPPVPTPVSPTPAPQAPPPF